MALGKAVYVIEGTLTGISMATDRFSGQVKNGVLKLQISVPGQVLERDATTELAGKYKNGDLIRITGPIITRTSKGRTFETQGG